MSEFHSGSPAKIRHPTHFLHLSQDILVSWKLAVEAEKLLLLLRQALYMQVDINFQ